MDPIKDIVNDVIQKLSQKGPATQAKIQSIWEEIVGEKGVGHTRIDSFEGGQLTVVADSPIWLYQLNTKKGKFLKDLQRAVPEVKSLAFKVGKT